MDLSPRPDNPVIIFWLGLGSALTGLASFIGTFLNLRKNRRERAEFAAFGDWNTMQDIVQRRFTALESSLSLLTESQDQLAMQLTEDKRRQSEDMDALRERLMRLETRRVHGGD